MRNIVIALLLLFSTTALAASNSTPNLYYGQVPTPAQWNSYFAAKLDYDAGAANTMAYWDGSGSFRNALVSGDCSSVANVFTCPLTNSAAALFATPHAIAVIAGTTTIQPLTFIAGTNNTAPVAGVVEYDGKAKYFTPVTGNRGLSVTEHFVNSSAVQTGSNVNTAQPWFVTTLTNGQITLADATAYEFEGLLVLSTSGTTSHSLAIGFAGTAGLGAVGYFVEVSENATGLTTITAVSRFSAYLNSASSTVVTTAVATATYDVVRVKGTMRVNTAGTFIPQFTYSAAPGVAPTIAIGTSFRVRPIGSNTVTNVGNWN